MRGETVASLSGPVDRIKSAKSLVDSVATLGSRAISPLLLVELVFVGVGRLCDRRFSAVEVLPSEVTALPVRLSTGDVSSLAGEVASISTGDGWSTYRV